jgi:hypothetical protein
VLDRVFISPAWEATFPLCALTAITRIGSDHNLLLLCSGEGSIRIPPRFFFQTWWFDVNGFGELVANKFRGYLGEGGPYRCRIDEWQAVAHNTRQFLKGWGVNLGKEEKAFRANIISEIESLDKMAGKVGLDEDGWAHRYHLEDQILAMAGEVGLDEDGWARRYHLEDQILAIFRMEEEYWRQRSRLQWTVKGDSCTKYFHAIANGRPHKCFIPRLITDQGEVDDQKDLLEHIYAFYQGLMGTKGEP